jgi:pimeloyl-ACP methyl ester carboxylesterase
MKPLPVKLHFQSHGEGKPLIIIHGALGCSSNWSKTSEILGRSLQVFALDLRNHGKSPHSGHFDYDCIAEDLKLFIEDRGLRKAAILGHSFGGRVAMEFADRYPGEVEKLVIVDIAPKAFARSHKVYLEAMMALDLAVCKSVNEVVKALAGPIPSLETRNFLAKNLSRSPDGRLRWNLNLSVILETTDALGEGPDFANRFDKPVLFIRGEVSDFILEEDEVRIREIYPIAKIVTIEKAGHWVHIDERDSFVRAVLDFLF